jgi:hypothetical protein
MNRSQWIKTSLAFTLLFAFTASAGSVRAAGREAVNQQKTGIRKRAHRTLARL